MAYILPQFSGLLTEYDKQRTNLLQRELRYYEGEAKGKQLT